MKILKYVIFLFLMLLSSCFLNKKSVKEHKSNNFDLSNNNRVDTVFIKEVKALDFPDKLEKFEKDSLVTNKGYSRKDEPKKSDGVLIPIGSSNNDAEEDGDGLIKGLIAYSVPKEMTVGEKYEIKVRISKDKNETKIVVGDRGIVIADTNTSNVFVEEIRVEPIMSAELMSDKSFEVDTLSTSVQNIDEHGYTEWAWAIRPLKSGDNYLRLVVKVRITTDQGVFYKDITVFDKNIKVKSNIVFSVTRWISEYWQWLITSIISPLIVWWYKNRKEKNKKKKST